MLKRKEHLSLPKSGVGQGWLNLIEEIATVSKYALSEPPLCVQSIAGSWRERGQSVTPLLCLTHTLGQWERGTQRPPVTILNPGKDRAVGPQRNLALIVRESRKALRKR